ncbi:Alpha/Beta hydrolase protein [Hysterangium stoloniferum]|nr:Alpha/Beta hydrolase protein [Hysterangium stoloniferum]
MTSDIVITTLASKDGVEIYAEAVGDPSKPHVVFIHGLGLSSIVWDSQFHDTQLINNTYAVRYDLRGHGRSGKPLDLTAWRSDRFAEDFYVVASAFKLNRPILVGWSYGCTPAVDVVNRFGAEFLGGIVYIGGLPYTSANHIVTASQKVAITGLLKHNDPEDYRLALPDYIKHVVNNPDAIPSEIHQSWTTTMASQPLAVFRRVLRREQDVGRFWERAGPVLPLLVIHGQRDNICDHDAAIAEARSKFQRVDIESWPDVGHAPFLERPQLFNAVVLVWVQKVSSWLIFEFEGSVIFLCRFVCSNLNLIYRMESIDP